MKRRIVTIGLLAVVAVGVTGILIEVRRWNAQRVPVPVYQGKSAKQWLGQVFSTNQQVAMGAFQSMGTDALPVLVRTLKDSDWDKTYQRRYAKLPQWAQQHLPAPASESTWSAAEQVLLNNKDTREVVPDLVRLLQDKNNRARMFVIGSLVSRIGPKDKEFTPVFSDCLKDRDPAIRESAAIILGDIGPGATAAVTDLMAALNDPANYVRDRAAFALWQINGRIEPSYSAAKKALQADVSQSSGWTVIYLSELAPDDPSVVPLLANTYKAGDFTLRSSAGIELGNRGASASAAIPVLVEIIEKESANLNNRNQALRVLKRIDPETAKKYE